MTEIVVPPATHAPVPEVGVEPSPQPTSYPPHAGSDMRTETPYGALAVVTVPRLYEPPIWFAGVDTVMVIGEPSALPLADFNCTEYVPTLA